MSELGEIKSSGTLETAQTSLIGTPSINQSLDQKTPSEDTIAETGEKVVEEKIAEPVKQEALTAESIKIPEGITIDDKMRDEFLGIMNNAELSPKDRGQALIDLQAKAMQAVSERSNKLWSDMQDTWIKDANTQFGEALAPMLGNIAKLLDDYGGTADQVKELRDVFVLTGAGNHPAMVRFLDNLGKPLREGGAKMGNPGGGGRTAAEVLYPNMPKE